MLGKKFYLHLELAPGFRCAPVRRFCLQTKQNLYKETSYKQKLQNHLCTKCIFFFKLEIHILR